MLNTDQEIRSRTNLFNFRKKEQEKFEQRKDYRISPNLKEMKTFEKEVKISSHSWYYQKGKI